MMQALTAQTHIQAHIMEAIETIMALMMDQGTLNIGKFCFFDPMRGTYKQKIRKQKTILAGSY